MFFLYEYFHHNVWFFLEGKVVCWAQYWELFTDRAPNSGKDLEKAKLITIWAWEIFCMSYFVEEFKTIILGKKANISNISCLVGLAF